MAPAVDVHEHRPPGVIETGCRYTEGQAVLVHFVCALPARAEDLLVRHVGRLRGDRTVLKGGTDLVPSRMRPGGLDLADRMPIHRACGDIALGELTVEFGHPDATVGGVHDEIRMAVVVHRQRITGVHSDFPDGEAAGGGQDPCSDWPVCATGHFAWSPWALPRAVADAGTPAKACLSDGHRQRRRDNARHRRRNLGDGLLDRLGYADDPLPRADGDRGEYGRPAVRRCTWTVRFAAASRPVPQSSPSPIPACTSPR